MRKLTIRQYVPVRVFALRSAPFGVPLPLWIPHCLGCLPGLVTSSTRPLDPGFRATLRVSGGGCRVLIFIGSPTLGFEPAQGRDLGS